MKALSLLAVLSLSGCATAIIERPNPSGGPPLTAFVSSSNADEITFTAASGATVTVRKLDNSTGPKEAIRVWSIFDLGRKITDVVGGLAGSAIDTFAGEQ